MKLPTRSSDRQCWCHAADNPPRGDGPKKDPAKRTLEALKSCNQKELILRDASDLFYRRNF
jgi:hypothetical protein